MKEENPEESISPTEKHRIKELEQEIEIKNEYIALLSEKGKSHKTPKSFQNSYRKRIQNKKETEQEKLILKELVRALEKKADLEIEQFLTMISHELKTPIVPIKAYVEMLQEGKFGELNEIQKQKLRVVDSSTKELVLLISNIIDFQKITTGKLKLQKKMTDIKRIIHDAFLAFWSELDSRDLRINSNFSNELLVMCDTQRISQVMRNLIQNSFYTLAKNSGKIKVSVYDQEKAIKVTVVDNGNGISEDELAKIFSKSYPIDTSNIRANGGIGIALPLCKQIIEAHGGKIWPESKAGKGTMISFTLPKKLNQ